MKSKPANSSSKNLIEKSILGKCIGNNIIVDSILAQGSRSTVYYAYNIKDNSNPFAVKFLSQNLNNETMRRRFAREAKICSQLGGKTPFIIKVKGYGIYEKKIPFYIMELLNGETLQKRITRNPLSLEDFLSVCIQTCEGLKVAHQGLNIKGKNYPIIHRDLKPSNIFIVSNLKKEISIKILDFGIAKIMGDQAQLTKTQDFVGTLAYCSPEQMKGEPVDERSDIYSLGIIMFELLTQELPWKVLSDDRFKSWYKFHNFESPRYIQEVKENLKLPNDLENIIRRCLAKKIKNRPDDIEEVRQELMLIKKQLITNKSVNLKPAIANNNKSSNIEEETKDKVDNNSIFKKLSWPKNKPIAKIVFFQSVRNNNNIFPLLWVMLSKEEINLIKNNSEKIKHTFLGCLKPYPLILWATAIPQENNELKWLTYYIDLTNQTGRKMLYLLVKKPNYSIVFFPQENPENCMEVFNTNVEQNECYILTHLFKESKNLQKSDQIEITKEILQKQLNILKEHYQVKKPEVTDKENNTNLLEEKKGFLYTIKNIIQRIWNKLKGANT